MKRTFIHGDFLKARLPPLITKSLNHSPPQTSLQKGADPVRVRMADHYRLFFACSLGPDIPGGYAACPERTPVIESGSHELIENGWNLCVVSLPGKPSPLLQQPSTLSLRSCPLEIFIFPTKLSASQHVGHGILRKTVTGGCQVASRD